MDTKEIIKLFTNGSIVIEDIESQKIESTYGIKLLLKEKSRFDNRSRQKEWVINVELGWGGSLSSEFPNRWDVTSDVTMACFRGNFVEYQLYEIVQISLDEQFEIQKQLLLKDAEKVISNNIVNTLTKVLINEMLPFHKVGTGFLETNYGIHLKQIQRDEHRFMRYKPRYGKENWVANKVLCWGSNTGWDITTDGKIACCRINYDDYVNFEIQVLTQDQIDEYKSKHNKQSQDSIKSMEILKRMFEAGLINHNEYENKRVEILKRV